MFNTEELRNLLILVNRAHYDNLAEAKAGVMLENKLREALNESQKPKQPTELVGEAAVCA